MKTILQRAGLAALSIAMLLVSISAGTAADVTFEMKNSHPNAVEVELYSQDRDHVWPGNNQVYLLDDGETKQIPLSCDQGEKICYGAWISGDKETYWGTGAGQCRNLYRLLLHLHGRQHGRD